MGQAKRTYNHILNYLEDIREIQKRQAILINILQRKVGITDEEIKLETTRLDTVIKKN